MKPAIGIIVFGLMSTAAFAQPQQMTPSQLALQLNSAIASLAQRAEQADALQRALAQSEARIKILEEKYEPKKPVEVPQKP